MGRSEEEIIAQYSAREPRFAQQQAAHSEDSTHRPFVFDPETDTWKREQDSAVGEAIIVCGGSLMYDRILESAAEVGDEYQFRQFFKRIKKAVSSGDLAIGSLGTVVAEMYPTVSTMSHSLSGRGHYTNARPEYLDGIRFGGFDALALSNSYNLDAGVRGVLATEANARSHGLVPSGLGRSKSPIFEVNGIRIALLSYSLGINSLDTLNEDGPATLLSVFDPESSRTDIASVRSRGAQFVLVYLDGRSDDGALLRKSRESAAHILAEVGADYVVCTLPKSVTRYSKYSTTDGRVVPIASGLGTLMAGIGQPFSRVSVMLRITLRLAADGQVEIEDSYIPTQRSSRDRGGILPVAVAHQFFGDSRLDASSVNEIQSIASKFLGKLIPLDPTRRVGNGSIGHPHFTPAQISELLGTSFSTAELKKFGSLIDEVLPIVATPDMLREGTCAFVMAFRPGKNSRTRFKGIEPLDVRTTLPTMAVAEHAIEGIPTLVVDDVWAAYMRIVEVVRARYDPFTVAITGTAGKTTTKDMLGLVFPRQIPTMTASGNGNTEIRAAASILRLSGMERALIQEVHGASPGSARALSLMVKPHVSIITSIGEGHLEQMGSLENIVKGKMGITGGLRQDGVLIINNDNDHLRALHPSVNTIRYGLEDPNVDYHARNVQSTGNGVSFEIVEPDGLAHRVHLYVFGKHNVSNALAVFAAARQALLPANKIIAGLSRFRSSSTRQNVIEVGGYQVFLDAFNSNVLSLTLALEAFKSIEPASPTGRRIVVMGDMGEQGDKFVENHELMGEKISEIGIDLFLGIGEGTAHTARIASGLGIRSSHFESSEELIRALSGRIIPGDSLLFKGSGAVNLSETVVYPLFGRIA